MRGASITRGEQPQFISCRNVDTVDLVDGDVVVYSVVTTVTHGQDVLKSTAGSQLTVAGVVRGKNIPPGEYGDVQVYGFHPNVKTTVAALAAGLTVVSDAAAAAVAGATVGAGLGVSLKLGAANRAGIFIKTLGAF